MIEQTRVTYYHGGPSGLSEILPPSVTGATSCDQLVPYPPGAYSREKVYVATEFLAAAIFAVAHARPSVYVVEPVGPLEDDPDCSQNGLSFACASARVLLEQPVENHMVKSIRRVLGKHNLAPTRAAADPSSTWNRRE